MRLPIFAALVALTGCPQPLEVCGDGIDNDEDGFIDDADSDCVGTSTVEACANGRDDDGDGAVDCADADCVLDALCLSEECDDGRDNDADDLVDCDDPDCSDAATCVGALVWALSGDAFVNADRTAYAGIMRMTDTVLDNDAGRYEIDDILCDARYEQLSNGGALPGNCPDCEWALPVGPSTYLSHEGPECDTWYNFTDPGSANYAGVWGLPSGIGFAPAYQGPGTSFEAVMFFIDDGADYNGWYAWSFGDDMSWDSESGALTWRFPIGYFAYQ